MPKYPHMVHFGIGDATYHALRVAVAESKEPSLKALLNKYSIAAAIKKYAPERVDDVNLEMGE